MVLSKGVPCHQQGRVGVGGELLPAVRARTPSHCEVFPSSPSAPSSGSVPWPTWVASHGVPAPTHCACAAEKAEILASGSWGGSRLEVARQVLTMQTGEQGV